MNQLFNFKRFGRFLYWDFVQHIRSYARLTGGLCIALCALSAFAVLCSFQDLRTVPDDWLAYELNGYLSLLGGGCLFVVLLVHVLRASKTFAPQKTKQQYINFMMQPSTTLEKYVGRLLSVGLISLLSGLIAVVAADLLHFLLSLVFIRRPMGSVTMYFFGGIVDAFEVRSSFPGTIMFCVGAWLYLYSTYVLGSALFNRNPMLWTTLVDFAVWMVLVPSVGFICSPLLQNGVWYNLEVPSVLIAAVWLLLVLNHVLAYRIFTRRQVVCHGLISL